MKSATEGERLGARVSGNCPLRLDPQFIVSIPDDLVDGSPWGS